MNGQTASHDAPIPPEANDAEPWNSSFASGDFFLFFPEAADVPCSSTNPNLVGFLVGAEQVYSGSMWLVVQSVESGFG